MVTFIDLKKAFDKVRYFDIFNLLMGIGAPKDVIQLLIKIYEHDDTKYKINGEISKSTENQKGVKQGASSSPILFNLII